MIFPFCSSAFAAGESNDRPAIRTPSPEWAKSGRESKLYFSPIVITIASKILSKISVH